MCRYFYIRRIIAIVVFEYELSISNFKIKVIWKLIMWGFYAILKNAINIDYFENIKNN